MTPNMQLALLALLGVTAAFPLRDGSTLLAGVAKINASVPIGVPLAGYNHGDRRVPHWPLPEKKAYTTFMTPSTGRIDPTWAKAVVIQDESGTKIAWGTFDGIGMDGGVAAKVFEIAAQKGLGVHPDNVILSGSHSHSGPGAVSTEKLWELAPATDLFVPEVQEQLATGLADALIEAEKNMKPAKIGTGIGNLPNATTNRRAKHSPYLHPWSIDPNLGVVSIDDAEGNIMATIWNFAIHGVCYGPDNMEASGDIMNGVCSHIESTVGGVALFVNADAGDVDPGPGMCDNKPQFKGAPIIGDAVVATRKTIIPSSNVSLLAHSQTVDFGKTDMNLTLARMSNCTKGGFLDICGICEYLHCDANLHLSDKWVEEKLKFTALRLNIDGVTTGVVTMPGEALTELGSQIRGDAKAMGFDKVLLAGYSQNHAGYFCTPDEYDIGGYESQLSFWGEDTSSKVRNGANTVLSVVKP